ncbi:MAG TPA: hypothetical protein VNE62_09135 [Actinomycetota bacterium]|nr:hypothetical protein [Actinomycetota bacterium]
MYRRSVISIVACLAIALAASATAAGRRPPVLDQPAPGTSALQASGLEHVANVRYDGEMTLARGGGSDIEFTTIEGRDYAFLGRLLKPVVVVDITNPSRPEPVAEIPCSLYQNDLQIQGTTLVMAADDGGVGSCVVDGLSRPMGRGGFATADISDPLRPRVLATATASWGAHNITLHPRRPLLYVSSADLENPVTGTTPGTDSVGLRASIDIWDVSDASSPTKVKSWQYGPGLSPHDITFNASGTRAYAASVNHTDIIDTTDAHNPSLVQMIVHPEIQISHQADPTPDGRHLLISDEVGGGLFSPACPGGGIHVYDISHEIAPVKVGVFWLDNVGYEGTSCTAHVFRINPDGKTMAAAWYNAGVHVFDISSLAGLSAAGAGSVTNLGVRTLGSNKQPNANTWAAKMWQERHPGYVFANDIRRGFDVFHLPSLGQ